MMWQPIETAPKNQTFLAVLNCAGEQTICTMRWPVAEAKNSRPDSKTFHVERVTHWMPLPDLPGAQPAPGAPWVSLAERMPNPDKHDRVLIYTEGYDFGGEQVFDVKAEALNECRYIDPDEQPETCKAASHWMPHPRNVIFDYAARYAQPAPSVPDVDALAQFIREIDGAHQLGAGVLAERIVEWLAAPEAKP